MISLDTMMVIACCLTLAYAAGHDIAIRTIPDVVSLCVGSLGLLYALLAHRPLSAIEIGAVVFLVGFILWRCSVLGGGDVKLMTAAAIWVRPQTEPKLFALVAVIGGVLACLYLALGAVAPPEPRGKPRTYARRLARVELRRVRRGGPIPYAVAIASATIFCLAQE